MLFRRKHHKVRISNIHQVEYREGALSVRFDAHLPDHILYLGSEKVSGGALSPADLEAIRGRVYEYLNISRNMKVDFQLPDGSFWQPAAS
jgi:hypothetical protein